MLGILQEINCPSPNKEVETTSHLLESGLVLWLALVTRMRVMTELALGPGLKRPGTFYFYTLLARCNRSKSRLDQCIRSHMEKVLKDERPFWMFRPSQAATWIQLHSVIIKKDQPAKACPNRSPTECNKSYIILVSYYVWRFCVSQQWITETELFWQLREILTSASLILSSFPGTKKIQRHDSHTRLFSAQNLFFPLTRKNFNYNPVTNFPFQFICLASLWKLV